MQFEESYNSILAHFESNNLAEAFSLLMDYAYENNADDRVMEAIFKLVAETDIKRVEGDKASPDNEMTKNKIIELLNSITVNKKNDYIEADPDIVKLSRDNFFNQTTEPVFSCKGVYKKLGIFNLQNISIDLRVGEITAVVGENGNGKTTLCRIVAGLLLKDQGKLSYPFFQQTDPEKLDWDKIKANIAYLSQEIQSLSGTVKNTLQLEASLHGIMGEENIQSVEFIIRRLGLTKYSDSNWQQLSGGYKLRFALARILLWRPQLLILDEPLANLDLKAQITVLSDLRDFADSIMYPMSILITSQHIHEIEFIADKIIFLRNGQNIYYDHIYEIGANRKSNNYEISCRLTPAQFENALGSLAINNIVYNGLYFELETPVEITSGKVLAALNAAKIEVLFFRDISNSTKKFLLANV